MTERAREAVFSMLADWVKNAVVLDLYAGSGSFGLEALSRGAASVVFVENGERALETLRSNIAVVGLGGTVVTSKVREFLERSRGRFHLVFVDPPWDLSSADLWRDLTAIDPLLEPEGDVVLSRRHTDTAPETPSGWRVATDRRYGDTRIIRYEKEPEPE